MKIKITRRIAPTKWFKNIFRNKQNNKFQLPVPTDVLSTIKKELNNLKNKNQYVSINNEKYHYSHQTLKAALKAFKKFDQNHLLMVLLNYTILKTKIKNKQSNLYLKIMKYATIISNYGFNKKNNLLSTKAQEVYELLIGHRVSEVQQINSERSWFFNGKKTLFYFAVLSN